MHRTFSVPDIVLQHSNDAINSILAHTSDPNHDQIFKPFESGTSANTNGGGNFGLGLPPSNTIMILQQNSIVNANELIPAIQWIKKSTPCLAQLLLLLKLATGLKLKIINEIIENIPIIMAEKQYWKLKLQESFIYGIQMTPRLVLNGIRTQFHLMDSRDPFISVQFSPLKGLFSRTNTSYTYPSLEKRVRLHMKQLDKFANIQANCLGLLARPRILFDPLSSTADLGAFLAGIREPLEKYLHEEITLLENISGSLNELHLPKSHLLDGDQFDEKYFVHIAATRLENVSSRLEMSRSNLIHITRKLPKPSIFERSWIYIGTGAAAFFYFSRTMTFNQVGAEILRFADTCVDTAGSFWKEWIVRPLTDILHTIQHKDSRLALLGAKSLASDLNSLERMVVSFAKDLDPGAVVQEVEEQVKMGDLSSVLKEYERDIKKPVRSIVSGSLVRSLLIQVQKAKVDGALALSALDKLLKSNELNFAFIAVIPTLLISYSVFGYFTSLFGEVGRIGRKRFHFELNLALRDIEKLVVRNEWTDEIIGYLLYHLVHLDQIIQQSSLESTKKGLMLDDVAELEKIILQESGFPHAAVVINRIRHFGQLIIS